MKLYSKISLQKAAGMLGVSKEEFLQLVSTYEKRESTELLKTPFEQTILARFVLAIPSLKFEIQADHVAVSEQAPLKNYTETYHKLNAKMIELAAEVLTLL